MAKHTIEEIENPTSPGDWEYLGSYNDALHFWVYKEGDGVVTYDLRIDESGIGFSSEIRNCLLDDVVHALDGFDSVEEALGFADAMMLQVHEDGEVTDTRVDM